MSAILLRLVVYGLIIGGIYFGVRKILGDWKARFQDLDREQHQRDLQERQRPDVIDLKRGEDGIYRPGGKERN